MREGGLVGVSVWVVGYLNLCLRDVSLFLLAFRVHNMCFCAQPNFNPFLSKLNSVCVCLCVRLRVSNSLAQTGRRISFSMTTVRTIWSDVGYYPQFIWVFSLSADVSSGCDWHIPLVRQTRESLFSYSDPSICCIFQLMQWHNPIWNQYPHIWNDKIRCCFKRVGGVVVL